VNKGFDSEIFEKKTNTLKDKE